MPSAYDWRITLRKAAWSYLGALVHMVGGVALLWVLDPVHVAQALEAAHASPELIAAVLALLKAAVTARRNWTKH